MWAGLNNFTGDYVTIMDCDLQELSELFSKMLSLIKEENYDIVGIRRVNRNGKPLIRSFFARTFYKIINKMCKVKIVDGARDFRIMTIQMLNSILKLREYNLYSKEPFSFVGFDIKWSFNELFIYAIEEIVAFSTISLTISIGIGLIF